MIRRRLPPRALGEEGQALLLILAVALVAVAGTLILGAFGQALGAKGGHQRGVDLAAVSAARVMREDYGRLFEAPTLEDGRPNVRHLEKAAYLGRARRAAVRAGRSNGVVVRLEDVSFPERDSFAPVRVAVVARGRAALRSEAEGPRRAVPVRARAEAELVPDAGSAALPATASGGGYSGPLAYRQGKPMRPDVALAFDRMARAARSDGVSLIVVSGFRTDAEQARLFAANPNPRMVARPGKSLHRNGTELDLGPNAAYGWLARNATRFGFLKRYSWEPWHYGYTRNPGSSSVGYGGDGRRHRGLPDFVPARYASIISRAAQRWNVGGALLAAQIYAESGFNPFARSGAGAQGIAQFMPGTARAYGLGDPFDAEAAINAQAHMMRDLLRRFGSVPLALAAYNAGPGAVGRCGCIPPFPETRAYVAKILGLLNGAGDVVGEGAGGLEVRLVE